jgi:hypothetical protein
MDLLPSQVRGEMATLLGPLERGNLSHWTTNVSITTAILIPETRFVEGI